MDPATILLILKTLLSGIPLVAKEYELLTKKDEYTDAERAEVEALFARYKLSPAWQEEPDPV